MQKLNFSGGFCGEQVAVFQQSNGMQSFSIVLSRGKASMSANDAAFCMDTTILINK